MITDTTTTLPSDIDGRLPTTSPSWKRLPSLNFYHANQKGSGAALQIDITPAMTDQDGVVFMSFAAQSSVAINATATTPKRFASFDWSNKVCIKLGFTEISEILMFFDGLISSIGGGKGKFVHTSGNATTCITISKVSTETFQGFQIFVDKTMKGSSEVKKASFSLRSSEAYGLGLALKGVMPMLAFGTQFKSTSTNVNTASSANVAVA